MKADHSRGIRFVLYLVFEFFRFMTLSGPKINPNTFSDTNFEKIQKIPEIRILEAQIRTGFSSEKKNTKVNFRQEKVSKWS